MTEHVDDFDKAYACAIRILARQEQSEAVLRAKLEQRSFSAQAIDEVVARCIDSNYQSDLRYAQQRFSLRTESCYGPEYIRAELLDRGVAERTVNALVDDEEVDWREIASRYINTRHPEGVPDEKAQQSKLYRKLISRGFSEDLVGELLHIDVMESA